MEGLGGLGSREEGRLMLAFEEELAAGQTLKGSWPWGKDGQVAQAVGTAPAEVPWQEVWP